MSRTWCSENTVLSLHISVVVHKDCKLGLLFCTSPTKEKELQGQFVNFSNDKEWAAISASSELPINHSVGRSSEYCDEGGNWSTQRKPSKLNPRTMIVEEGGVIDWPFASQAHQGVQHEVFPRPTLVQL